MKWSIALLAALILATPASAQLLPPLPRQDEPVNTYDAACRQSVKTGKPLACFVGCQEREFKGYVTVRMESLEGDATPRIVLADPDGKGWLVYRSTLRPNAALPREEVGRSADPFPLEQPQSVGREAQEVGASSAPWPEQLTFLADLEPYTPATRTQISFRRWSGYIGSVPRTTLERKWLVAGGLENVTGWTSRLYRTKNAAASVRLVTDGDTITWGRTYDGDVTFADVLRNAAGAVFEVRVAEKYDGRWDRFVAYSNSAARPNGYVRVPSGACVSCHLRAGDAAYGAAVIPGGDSVLSDPIGIVESGRTVQGGFGLQL